MEYLLVISIILHLDKCSIEPFCYSPVPRLLFNISSTNMIGCISTETKLV